MSSLPDFLVAMRPTQWGDRGAAEVAGHLQDIVLGGATSKSGLLQGQINSASIEGPWYPASMGGARKVPAWSPQPSSAEDSARQAASFPAAWILRSSRSTTPSQDGRNVGGSSESA